MSRGSGEQDVGGAPHVIATSGRQRVCPDCLDHCDQGNTLSLGKTGLCEFGFVSRFQMDC